MSSRLWHALAVLTFVAGGLISEARADTIAYAHDALGRLIQATDNTTQRAIIYNYDSVGNIVSQQAAPLTTLAISGFSTNEGAPGSQITIDGTGFSSTPGANTVMINGVAATVVSATQTQLVVDLPSTATSGPITVTIGSTTVTSSNSLTVGTGGALPTITSFSPTIGAPGTVVTVSGSGFQATASGNSVEFNQSWAQVSAATPTTLTTSVPAEGTSGPITVATPFGQAVSGASFIVPPSGYSSGNIGSTGNLTIGSPAVMTISANRAALRLFNGTRGQLLAIGVSADAIASCTIKVFDPAGNLLVTSAAITASGQGVQIPALPRDGTYTIVVDPGSNTGSLTLIVVGPVQGALNVNGAALPVTLSVPGQAAQLAFSGTQGAYVRLNLSAVTIRAGQVSVITPSGATLISTAFGASGIAVGPYLPVTGTYTVVILPAGAITGSLSANLVSSNINAVTNQSPYAATVTNQTPVSVVVTGATNQYLTLVLQQNQCGVSGTVAISGSFTVLKPDGTSLTTGTFAGSNFPCTAGGFGTTVVNLEPLPQSGTYTIVFTPTSTGTGTLTFAATSPTVAGPLVVNGAATSVTIGQSPPAQGILVSFPGTAGQYLALTVSQNQVCTSGGAVYGASLTVLQPDGAQLATGTFNSSSNSEYNTNNVCINNGQITGSTTLNLGPFPSSGTYQVLFQQKSPLNNVSPGTATLAFSAVP